MNPLMGLIGGMGGNNPMAAMAQAINVINQIKQNGNPQAAINAMAQQNLNVKKAMEMCQGKNPQQVFEQICRQNGIDPTQFAGMMK